MLSSHGTLVLWLLCPCIIEDDVDGVVAVSGAVVEAAAATDILFDDACNVFASMFRHFVLGFITTEAKERKITTTARI